MTTEMKDDLYRMVSDLSGETNDNILSVDTYRTVDVLLAFGGPTVFFRLLFNADGELVSGEYHNSEYAQPVELLDCELEELEPYLEGLV